MSVMKSLMDSLPWHRLRPAPQLLAEQPGEETPHEFISAARTDAGDVVLVYSPTGGRISVCADAVRPPARAEWWNPRNSERTGAAPVRGNAQSFEAPDDEDWLLCIRQGD